MNKFNDIFLFEKLLTKNKAIEIQISTFDMVSYFDLNCSWGRSGDHAGFVLHFEVYGFMINLNIYDIRHWNYDADRFYEVNEKEDWSQSSDIGNGVKLTHNDLSNLIEVMTSTPEELKRVEEAYNFCSNKVNNNINKELLGLK